MKKVKLTLKDAMPDFSLIREGDLKVIAEGLEEIIYNYLMKKKKCEKPP